MKHLFASNKIKIEYVLASVIFTFFLLIYGYNAPHQATGVGESNQILSFVPLGNLAPSPGYPLYSLVVYLSTRLAATGDQVVTITHLVSVIISSLALSTTFLFLYKFYCYFFNTKTYQVLNKGYQGLLLAAILTLSMGFSGLIFRYSLVAEPYSLTWLLTALTLYLLMAIFSEKKKSNLYFLALGIVIGTGVTQSVLFVLLGLVAVFAISVAQKIKINNWIWFAILVVASSIFNWGLLALFQNTHPYALKIDKSLIAKSEYVLSGYLTSGVYDQATFSQILEDTNLNVVLDHLKTQVGYTGSSLGWILLILSLVGFVGINHQSRTQLKVFLFPPIVAALFLGFTLGWPSDSWIQERITANFVVVTFLAMPIIFFGLVTIIDRFGKAFQILFAKKYFNYLSLGLLGLLPLSNLYLNFNQARLSDKLINQDINRSILQAVEPESLLVCFSRQSCSGLILEQTLHQTNKQVEVVPYDYKKGRYNLDLTELELISYDDYPWILFDIVSANLDKRPIYSVDMFSDYYDLFGVNIGALNYLPKGYLAKLDHNIPNMFAQFDYSISDKLESVPLKNWDKFIQSQKLYVANIHVINASVFVKMGLKDRAYSEMNQASNLYHQVSDRRGEEIRAIRSQVESLYSTASYRLGSSRSDLDQMLEEVDNLIDNGFLQRANQLARGATLAFPDDPRPRLAWAKTYEIVEASASAVLEYNNVLKLDPDNATAQTRLKFQSQLPSSTKGS